jgi:hypothetical protein
MEFLSDDPTYLAGGLGLLGGVFLVALRLTQQGKYLVWAAVSLALALLVVGVERVWVTDNERIEETVYGLGRAVEESDAAGVLARLTPDVQYVASGNTMLGEPTRALVERVVSNSRFEFVRITHLRTNAGGRARRGTAEFRVLSSGSFHGPFNTLNFGTSSSAWSLGLRETSPGVWKVNRITPVYLPAGQNVLPTTYFRTEPLPAPPPDFPRRFRRSGFSRRAIPPGLEAPPIPRIEP